MAKRNTTERPYNCGTMSEAEFRSMIVSALRNSSRFWKPKAACIRKAKVAYNSYKCELCGTVGPSSLPPLPGKKRKRKNIQADHILPVVPTTGWVSYDSWIERAFVETEGFQAICYECHSKKTKEENKERRLTK